ncbi:unnamed protein product [Plutella xylostella]|uniref:S-formylglutathione hydrolase n=1 Tax=Plutella xylostella TaxID=51655 RepID=A0A8S4E658_PLUXY|nr:unnamed protein product [Plutella xylostella]
MSLLKKLSNAAFVLNCLLMGMVKHAPLLVPRTRCRARCCRPCRRTGLTEQVLQAPGSAAAFLSMGGHGALVSTLRNPGLYKSVSAFAPICNPCACPWGEKAFTGYIGDDKSKWAEWDATELVKHYDGPPLTLLIDQGGADKFYTDKQLLPENLVAACRSAGVPVILNLREGYDHSYYYIATYIGEHFDFHAKILKA